MLTFFTKPEAVNADPERSAVIEVDMQNAFASKRGMFGLSRDHKHRGSLV